MGASHSVQDVAPVSLGKASDDQEVEMRIHGLRFVLVATLLLWGAIANAQTLRPIDSVSVVDSSGNQIGNLLSLEGPAGATVALDVDGRLAVLRVTRTRFVGNADTSVLFDGENCTGNAFVSPGADLVRPQPHRRRRERARGDSLPRRPGWGSRDDLPEITLHQRPRRIGSLCQRCNQPAECPASGPLGGPVSDLHASVPNRAYRHMLRRLQC